MFSYLLIGQLHQIIMNDFLIHFSKLYKMIFHKKWIHKNSKISINIQTGLSPAAVAR
jgi:hypothetical protein